MGKERFSHIHKEGERGGGRATVKNSLPYIDVCTHTPNIIHDQNDPYAELRGWKHWLTHTHTHIRRTTVDFVCASFREGHRTKEWQIRIGGECGIQRQSEHFVIYIRFQPSDRRTH